ncbi:LolA family protein [Methanosarcina spelaei]|uniref:LolA family protein n=1 Tax=Methanosarcina spelaei TaxID=1036679 RepID=UPI001FE7EFE0|nr:outer membrane lipoprotein carrier protein LolA [Methanosarcina spelaei]
MITKKKFRSIIMLAAIIMALFASGCTEKNISAEEIATQMLDKQNGIQDYSYTAHMISYMGGKLEESESNIMIKKPNMFKEIITEPGKENKTISISDGEIAWSYTPDTNTVTKIKLPKASEPTRNDYINIINEFLNDTNVTVLGVENVDGRKTYLLETTPKEKDGDYELIYKTKIWIDQETWMPLRYETYNGDGNLTIKVEIRDLKVNTEIPDSEFKFEIPSGAKVVDLK